MNLKMEKANVAGVDMALIKCNLSHELNGSVQMLLWLED